MKKKSIVPLLAIAFIVAVVSTGIFYGLFVGTLKSAPPAPAATAHVVMAARALPSGTVLKKEDLRLTPWVGPKVPAGAFQSPDDLAGKSLVAAVAEHELLTRSKVGSVTGLGIESGSLGIPEGMRAVSLQVQDSSGVVALLKPGHKVDVQVVSNLSSQGSTEPYLRTVLENMTVLTVPHDVAAARGSQVVTVLATPREAAALGLADSSAKLRIALRNPLDPRKDNLNAIALSSLFKQSSPFPPEKPNSAGGVRPVRLVARLIGVQPSAWQQLTPYLLNSLSNLSSLLQVSPLRRDPGLEPLIAKLAAAHELEVGGVSRLMAYGRREVSLKAGSDGAALRVNFQSLAASDGVVRLRVQPEFTLHSATRRIDTEIELRDGQSFVMRGLADPDGGSLLWGRLFPQRKASVAWPEVILVVDAKLM